MLGKRKINHGTADIFLRRSNMECALSRYGVDRVFVPWAGHILGPLIVWLAKRGDSAEIDAHGKESLNFQISMLIYSVIGGVLCLVLIGFLILVLLHILNVVLVIVASIQASEGKFYRYPLAIRLIK